MAFLVSCGQPARNEQAAIAHLTRALSDEWVLFTSIPRHVTGDEKKGREIDAVALGPRGAIVIELKNFGGEIAVSRLGDWLRDGEPIPGKNGQPIYPLQQAEKAAQTLKSALGVQWRRVYIDYCAIATAADARVRYQDTSQKRAAGTLSEAAEIINALGARTAGTTLAEMQHFFDFLGKTVPAEVSAIWQRAAPRQPPPRPAAPPPPPPRPDFRPVPPPSPVPPSVVPFPSRAPRLDRSDPDPDFHPWQWVGGIVGLLVIVSIVRSCVAGLTASFSPTPQPPQAVVSSPADAPTTVAPTYYRASFNCSRARGWAEQQICSTEPLADSDRRQAELYSSVMARAVGADKTALRHSQRTWVKMRNGCSDVACIEQAYADRITFLQGWTPTPSPADDATRYGAPLSPQRDDQNVPSADTITCILPYGQEMQGTRSECERLGGSVYN
jgi:uncharacterized protein YecT (DUF1311 family)